MSHHTARGIYITVGAALGVLAARALAKQKSRSSEFDETAAEQMDEQDMPTPVQEALWASERAHGLSRPVAGKTARELANRAESRKPTGGAGREEVSSLVPPHALAPSSLAAGEELVDPGAIEVPIGYSADDAINTYLSHTKLPQADSSGAALERSDVGPGVYETANPRSGFGEEALTARSFADPVREEEAYDAVAPDDLASEWLSRATEARAPESMGLAPEAQPPEAFRDAGMAVVSEASLDAANADEIEADASADLDAANADEIEADANADLDEEYVAVDLDELRGRGKQ